MRAFMAIDQHGNTWHDLGRYPRKELLSRLCRSRAEKLYREGTDGETRHVGYIIGTLWLTLYTVTAWEGTK